MDHASPRLEGRAQPLRHHLRKPAAGELGTAMTANESATPKSRAVETVEKRTACFSTVPTAPTTTGKYRNKNSRPRKHPDHLHKTLDATGAAGGPMPLPLYPPN